MPPLFSGVYNHFKHGSIRDKTHDILNVASLAIGGEGAALKGASEATNIAKVAEKASEVAESQLVKKAFERYPNQVK